MKKFICLLLATAFLLCLCACGGDEGPYRVLETIGEKQYGLIFRKGDKVSEPVNAAMSVLAANGSLTQLSIGWLGEDIIGLEGDIEALMQLEMAAPIETRVFIVGVEKDARPLAYTEGEGYIGMSCDLAKAIGELLGWEVRLQPILSDELETQLSSGNIDCALGFGVEGIDTGKYDVGSCYMKSSIQVAVRSDSEVKKLRNLDGMKVGTVLDDSFIRAAQSNEKLAKYADSATTYFSVTRCFNALDKGWCAAVALDEIALNAYFK